MSYMKLAITALTLLYTPVALLAHSDQAGVITSNENGPVLTLSVTGSAQGQPDRAIIRSGVTATAPTAREAIAANARKMKSLFAALVKLGVERRFVSTSRISLNAEYERHTEPGQQRQIVGYNARNDISVRLKDIQKTGGAIDALIAAGGHRVSGPQFDLNDDTALVQKAREDAMKQIRGLSQFYAKSMGYRQAEIISISENVRYSSPPISNVITAGGRPSASTSTPVQAGDIQRTVAVNVQYRLIR